MLCWRRGSDLTAQMKEGLGAALDDDDTPQARPSPSWFSEEKHAPALRARFDDGRPTSLGICHDRHLSGKLIAVEH